jgi:putative hemolysin
LQVGFSFKYIYISLIIEDLELIIIFILTLLNGFFALSEIALVSVKKNRMEHLANQGNVRAKNILKLLDQPENFLSSVQVGITLIGIISGAYGGAALTDDMIGILSNLGMSGTYVDTIALAIVIGGITYFTIVIGELVPKTIAMNNADSIALFTVPIIKYFTLITFPFVKLLSFSTGLILKIFGVKEKSEDSINEEELRFILKTAGKQGILETEESQIHQNLFSFTDQIAKSLMTHSSEMEWVNDQKDKWEICEQLKKSVHSKFIVAEGNLENVKGIIHVKEFLENLERDDFEINQIIRKPIYVSESTPAFKILNTFKHHKQYIAIVVDEYGTTEGIITIHDLFEAIVGDLPDEDEQSELDFVKREDGSYLINGRTLIFELNQYFGENIIEESMNDYTTLAGFLLYQMKEIPKAGDKIIIENTYFEVMDMDGIKIDKVLFKIESGL